MPGETLHNRTAHIAVPKPEPSGTMGKSNRQAGNRRKERKGENGQGKTKSVVANIPKSGQKMVNDSSKIDPGAKKKERLEKKELVPGNCQDYKPVIDIKTPEDYSANWKMLKEVRNRYSIIFYEVSLYVYVDSIKYIM